MVSLVIGLPSLGVRRQYLDHGSVSTYEARIGVDFSGPWHRRRPARGGADPPPAREAPTASGARAAQETGDRCAASASRRAAPTKRSDWVHGRCRATLLCLSHVPLPTRLRCPSSSRPMPRRNKYWGRGPSMRFDASVSSYIDSQSRQKIRDSILTCDILPLTLCHEP